MQTLQTWNPKKYLLAGRATVTVTNPAGTRYTFKVTKKELDEYRSIWFVGLLTGPDNEHSYTYMGMLDPSSGWVRLTTKSNYGEETLPVKVARWAFKELFADRELPDGYKCYHAGSCGRCGRKLTVPESIDSGFGPDCIRMIGGL